MNAKELTVAFQELERKLQGVANALASESTTITELEGQVNALNTMVGTLDKKVQGLERTLQGVINSMNTILNQRGGVVRARQQNSAQRENRPTTTGSVGGSTNRPPSEGGWVGSIGQPHTRANCPTHGSVNLNKFGCCFHCFNDAARARAAFRNGIRNGSSGNEAGQQMLPIDLGHAANAAIEPDVIPCEV